MSEPTGEWVISTACEGHSTAGCQKISRCPHGSILVVRTFILFDGTVGDVTSDCASEPAPNGASPLQPTVTPARVLRAFREIPLPASDIAIQPAGGETLVNHPTFYRTDATAFDETVTFFGGRVTVVLHITPDSFQWNHGDGTTATTTDPGSEYVKAMGLDYDHLVFHEYARAARGVPASVDTTWSATWTLNGRDMGAVPGTVTMAGTPQRLDIFEARPVLVS